jgi:DNA invertase Pin-like site-specific DNA recombinase
MAVAKVSTPHEYAQATLRHDSDFSAALYSRVSTTNGQDPEMQLRELRDYCSRRGWRITADYVDVGISGSKEKRPELDRLLADAHRRRFDAVVVWRFDRFARSVSHLLRALETFRSLGIEFVSLSEQVDTSTPTGKMIFTVLGAVAELERSLIAERVRAGLRNARAKGKRLGRPKSLLDPGKVVSMRAQGATWRAIGTALGVAPATAYNVSQGRLINPKVGEVLSD